SRMQSPGRRSQQEALLYLGLFGVGEHRRLDTGRDRGRNPRAHGAIWLHARAKVGIRRGTLRLAKVYRQPGACARGAAITSTSKLTSKKRRLGHENEDPSTTDDFSLDSHRD